MKAKLTTPVLAIALAAAVFAGCGSSNKDKGSTGGANNAASSTTTASTPATTDTTATTGGTAAGGGKGEQVKLSADASQLKFNTTSLSAKAGTVTLAMDNPSSIPHAIAVEGNGVDKDGKTIGQGATSTVTVDLKAGKYTYYCPVPGHRQAGMEGTLTVK
jgi:plastocyanin